MSVELFSWWMARHFPNVVLDKENIIEYKKAFVDSYKLKELSKDAIRVIFENQPKEFYGGNNLQRDGDGYCSSYVNQRWETFIETIGLFSSIK